VPSEFFYFMAVGGLGVTLAGFAGLIAALQGREGPVAAWRIRNVVFQGFGVTIVGFGTVALYTITQDVTLTARLASIVMVVTRATSWGELRPSAAWRDERQRRGAIFIQLAFAVAVIVNIALASVGYLQLLLLVFLTAPAGIFALAVRDVPGATRRPSMAQRSPKSDRRAGAVGPRTTDGPN
jgi:hypothetical protein